MKPEDAIRTALREDNASLFRETLQQNPEIKERINAPLGPFDSALIHCVRSRQMLDAFLEAGADINARSKWWAGGFGLLDLASDDIAAYALERGARLEVHSAARLGMIAELRRMLEADSRLVHARGGDGKTPLHFARKIEVAKLLVQHGADINARDIDHESTPAQHLIDSHQDVVRYLLSCGCQTDIFLAAALGDNALAVRFMDADPNCLRMRVNPEHFPMKHPHAGGTIYQWTLGFNISPHEVARKFGNEQTFALLMERSPVEVRFLVNCWMGREEEAQRLLAQNPSLVQRLLPYELRQLPDAARNNNLKAVKWMFRAGLPLTARGQHRGTALHWAAWHGNADMVRLLISPSAPLEDADNDFQCSPLAWAIHGSENSWNCDRGDFPATVQALLDAGAKIPLRTDGTPEVRKILESHTSERPVPRPGNS